MGLSPLLPLDPRTVQLQYPYLGKILRLAVALPVLVAWQKFGVGGKSSHR